ncbi:MAG: glycosyltransferase family 4 protein [Candidatus Binatia bacterium]
MSKAVKVTIVAPMPPPFGGMSLQAQALCRNLAREGLDVNLVATNPSLPLWLARIRGLRTVMQTVIYLGTLARSLLKANVVHVLAASHWYFFLRVVPAVVLGRCLGCRVVLNYRGGAAPRFFAKWRALARPVLYLAHVIVVPSRFLERLFGRYGFSARVIPNLVDLERFRFRKRDRLSPYLIVTRNLEPVYNVQMALQAFERIKTKYPQARIEILGSGTQAALLKDWVQTRGLKDVYFQGAVPNEQVPSYLERSDILVNPSLVDNMPINLLEAFASGLPVVTTRVGGIPDLVGKEKAALLVEPGDDAGMAEKIEVLLGHPQKAGTITARARELSQEFSWNSIKERWLEVYDAGSAKRSTPPAAGIEP